ncbi:MAG: lactoylglutathione lyase [Dorea sp.]|jgi:lactoylglutathione lyase|nr:lactoylglutathione lyase [Dorea sp.]MCI9453184.1 lactoylglutathione lyase [Dorea sp.]
MKFTFYHNNINVLDLGKSIEFYKKALGLTVTKKVESEDGSFKLAFLGDGTTPHLLELTWLRDMDRPYNLGDNESHLAMRVDDMDAALALHKEMDCVCFENPEMGIYFINDPDGYWIEICPAE